MLSRLFWHTVAALIVALSMIGISAPESHAASLLPAPTGPHHVGRVNAHLIDEHRAGRDVMVTAWYPTTADAGRTPYISHNPVTALRIAAQTADWLHEPLIAATMATASVPAADRVPVAQLGRLPVVVFSPGMAVPRFLASGLAADLASRGYIVVTVDHTGEAPAVELPDGRIVFGTPPTYTPAYMAAQIATRTADVRLVLDRLPTLPIVGPVVDTGRIAVAGHSYGGFTAATVGNSDERVRAVVVLDGVLAYDGAPPVTRVDRPVLLLGVREATAHPSWQLVHGDVVEVPGAGHYTFTDVANLLPFSTRLCGTVSGSRANGVTFDRVATFLDRAIR